MTQHQIKVVFQPQNRTVYILNGTNIVEAAALAGITINTPCGGAGICGKCKVRILYPQTTPTKADEKIFNKEQLHQGFRLACQNKITQETTIEIPRESLFLSIEKIVAEPTITEGGHSEIQAPARKGYGVAIDVGTTTLAASLVRLTDGAEVAVMGSMNPQISFGDDVISRIKYASSGGLTRLQETVIKEINTMIGQLCKQSNIQREDIYSVAIAGNTTMEHLVCGIDPSPLGQIPFEPVYRGGQIVDACRLKLEVNPDARAYLLPVIGGFIGGDISAGILAADLLNQPQPLLFIDIGTNGEIVLVNGKNILAASTAAGPAFEGARISCGMRATIGAIEKVQFNDNCRYNVIGNVEPVGICGSGLIDITAELLNAKIVEPSGRMSLNEFAITDRVRITQQDIRQIQLAVGAIRAGINMVLRKANIEAKDLERIFVAGGFGSFIRRKNAQRIGLLPAEVEHQKISFVGNTSLAGAKLTLLSEKARQKVQNIANQAKHIELSSEKDFQEEFVKAMIFPSS